MNFYRFLELVKVYLVPYKEVLNLRNLYRLFALISNVFLTFVPRVELGIIFPFKQYQDSNFRFKTINRIGDYHLK